MNTLQQRILECRTVVIGNIERVMSEKQVSQFLRSWKLQRDVRECQVDQQNGDIRLEFKKRGKAIRFYQQCNFADRVLSRLISIHLQVELSQNETQSLDLEGIAVDKLRNIFLECRKLGFCNININYSSRRRGKLQPKGVVSYYRTQNISQQQLKELSEGLSRIGVQVNRAKNAEIERQTVQIKHIVHYKHCLLSDIDCSQHTDEQICQMLGDLLPVKLVNTPQPIFHSPNRVKVIITNQPQNAEPSIIPYESSQLSQAKHLQIPIEEFTTYNGPLALSIAQMSLSAESYTLPAFVERFFTSYTRGKKKSSIYKVNLWHYLGDRISKWHYDGHDNILFMLKGRKIVYLVEQCRGRGRSVFDVDSNHGLKDSFEEFVTDGKDVWKCEVLSGQAVFIPRGWWHYVESYGQTQAINIWGNSFSHISQPAESFALLKHLLFQHSDSLPQKPEQWQHLDEDIKRKYRRTNFQIFFHQKLA